MSESRKITMEDITIQAWELDRLKPAENNHKKHSDESTAKLAGSLADIGQIQPVIVDKGGEIIAGHGRWMAAKRLGWDKIKVIQVPVTRDVAIKARIADNLMSNQDIDNEKLAAEISELMSLNVDVDLESIIIDDGLAGLHDMRSKDDFGMDSEAISEDILEDARKFTEENEEIMKAAEGSAVPVRNVLGFNTVTPSQARTLKDFMAVVIDERSEEDPAEALAAWVNEVMS